MVFDTVNNCHRFYFLHFNKDLGIMFLKIYLGIYTNLMHSRSLSLFAVQVYIIKIVRTVARGGQTNSNLIP